MQDYHRIRSDGHKDLSFTGEVIGKGSRNDQSGFRGTLVLIFKTAGGNYVAHVHQWSSWQEESAVNRAEVFKGDQPEDIYNWLVEDAGGILGPASKEAWEEACRNDPNLQGLDVETVA